MTTITIEKNINFGKCKFKDILDLKNYLENYLEENFYPTKLAELEDAKITLGMEKKMQKTKELNASHFVNV